MSNKTKAILEITAPNGQEFVDKGVIVNQTKGLNGVCVELYIPTKAIEAQKPIAIDKIMQLVDAYAHAYAFVGDDRMPIARKDVLDALQSIQNPVDTDSLQDLIAQYEADKKAYPLTWWKGWQFSFGNTWVDFSGGDFDLTEDSHGYQRKLHAEIIMQCEQDKIDYPEFWWGLIQFRRTEKSSWLNPSAPYSNFNDYEYRQHPHRKSIIRFNQCSKADKKRWQILDQDRGWITPCSQSGFPNWHEHCEYRLRPKMCFITLQDGTKMEFPESVREAFELGAIAFLVNPIMGEITEVVYRGCEYSKKYLRSGLLHATQENALQHLVALQAMNAQVAL